MSRLTYFHKAMPEDIPRPVQLPASPPDTELDHMIPSVQDHVHEPVPETAASRFRRVASTVSYHSTGAPTLRETQRVGPRASRWLVVVLPPPSLTKEPAVVGNTLSTSPSGRFGNGILMPLFPTMYGQLTAIAREFGLPSVSGVCIYLQMTDSGLTMTPRVTDETWPFLWGHFFDDSAPPPGMGLPISGRIEFDIDVRKALWYHSWIGVQRGEVPIPPSVAPSASYHRKRESRSTLFGDDDARSENGLFPLQLAVSSRATAVNRPSKLSLAQRNGESSGANAASRDIVLLDSRSPPSEQEVPTTKRLSPIPQDEEPVTAKRVEADNRVMQWRMASGTSPNPPSNKTGQISLDPAHMPNSAPETPADGLAVAVAAGDDEEEVELNLDDFDWSISSAGPRSCLDSPNWPEPLPSVHLEYRLQGSVPPTPSTATTGWPYDYPDSPFALSVRLPSPDIAYRMLDDAPCTPTTATSWGPASYAGSPISEYSEYYAASLDVGQRATWSRPVTPATATSWGPQESYPASPLSPVGYVYTPGIADRSFDVQEDGARPHHPRAASFPYYDAWTREPWSFVWPYRNQFQESEDAQPLPGIPIDALEYPFEAGVYPHSVQVMLPGSHGYPFVHGIYPVLSRASVQVMLDDSVHYPFTDGIYPACMNQSSAVANKLVQVLLDDSVCYPFTDGIYPTRMIQSSAVSVKLIPAYPYLQASLYPAVYPHSLLEIYPLGLASAAMSSGIPIGLPADYPLLDIYPAVYPHCLSFIYPPMKDSFDSAGPLSVRLPTTYPALTIYATVYPNFDIYPEPSAPHARPERPEQWRISATVELPSLWPTLTIYPTTYPHFKLYPAAPKKLVTQAHADIVRPRKAPAVTVVPQSSASHTRTQPPVSIRIAARYPWIEEYLYPSVYPHNLRCIYPQKEAELIDNVPVASYPFATGIYPAVYPYNLDFIYVPITSEVESVPKALSYPFLSGIYPAVYPYNLDSIYMPISGEVETGPSVLPYPFLCGVYPAVYPYSLNVIYMPIAQEAVSSLTTLSYPFLTGVYPAVYPHSLTSVYPRVQIEANEGISLRWVDCKLQSRYPYIQLYESVYPHVCPYPSSISWPADGVIRGWRSGSPQSRRRSATVSRQRDGKTHAVRGSLSRRISAEGAPPVPAIPAHIRTPSTSPVPSRHTSLTVQTIPEATVARPVRKTHQQLHERFFHNRSASQGGSSPAHTSLANVQFFTAAEDLLAFLDRNEFPSPPTERRKRSHDELHRLVFPQGVLSRSPSRSPSEENLASAGSARSALTSTRSSPTTFSQGHNSRRSVVLEKVKQFSPADDAAGALSRSASSTSASARRVSKLDRSRYPFA